MAVLYPLMVEILEFLSVWRCRRKSATSCMVAFAAVRFFSLIQ